MFIDTQTATVSSALLLSRSELEIDRALQSDRKKIRASIQERLQWLYMMLPVLKKVLASVIHQPG